MEFVPIQLSKCCLQSTFALLYQAFNDTVWYAYRYPLALRQEVFQKVERQFMLGLRAKDPDLRMKFSTLYHESLGRTLFTRLQFIIQVQDWEALGDIFWLKQGLDLLLAILVEDKPITLAPNSARVVPLVFSDSHINSSGPQQQAVDFPLSSPEASLTLDSIILKHAQFMSDMSKLKVGETVLG